MRLLRHIAHFLPGFICGLLLSFYALLPNHLFNDPYSTVVYDRSGKLLGARVASDGQWRFPETTGLPEGYVKSVLRFEDKRFYNHFGVDILALGRAFKSNLKAGRVVQGGSTITMQVVRMALKNQPRTYSQKLKEILLALRIELAYSKDEILTLYAAHAPFGGNVVGLEAASWRYFGRSPKQLSEAEYALLAVLPNAPAVLRPGKNNSMLLHKRNFVLEGLFESGELEQLSYELALLEEIPNQPKRLPNYAPHITQEAMLKQTRNGVETTLELAVQKRTAGILNAHHKQLSANGVHNAALLVADVSTGEVLAYHGNTNAGKNHGEFVDIIRASRSSGSILKPFLYAAMQSNGQLLPAQLVTDIPTFLSGFQPENYNHEYEGAVPADEALARSLNIPAVRELRNYGVGMFKLELEKLGFESINRSVSNYGLSLIVGGAEVSLWDVAQAYLKLAQSVKAENHPLQPWGLHVLKNDTLPTQFYHDAGAAYLALHALRKHDASYSGAGWLKNYASRISWKTGTSFGYRDAWAVGVTPNHLVAVWVGNADGEGRPGVVGAQAAAPIMFEVMSALSDEANPFTPPYNHLVKVNTCAKSGFLASLDCSVIKSVWSAKGAENAKVCEYHQNVILSPDGNFRISEDCKTEGETKVKSWFVLPPAIAYYYQKKHAHYLPLPPISASCLGKSAKKSMELIYPSDFQRLVRTKQENGVNAPIVFKLAHNNPEKKVYWHANEHYIGQTKDIHEMPITLSKGRYELRIVDEDGKELSQSFEVL